MTANDKHLEQKHIQSGDHQPAGTPITDAKDNALQKRQEQRLAVKAFRFTKGDNPFTIDMGDGEKVQDKRPMSVSDELTDIVASEPGHRTAGSDKSHNDEGKASEQIKATEWKLVDLGDGVKAEEVTPANCSEKTKKLWETMSSTEYKGADYNCFSAVLEYVQPGGIPSAMHVPAELRLVLKAHGWKEHKDMDLDSGGHKAGEVVMVTDADKHTHAAIVSKVENGHIVELEQKPNGTDPPIKTSLKQFKELFKPTHAEIYQKDN